ncbi:MAG: amidohydrolase family protein [Candidatus Velthaea sp.]
MSVRTSGRPRRIDFHTHIVPRSLERFVAPAANWPELILTAEAGGHLARNGTPFRALDDRSWNAARRIADMEAANIDVQVLSPLPATFAYEFAPEDTHRFAQLQNDAIAEFVGERPDRFAGLGTLALQSPDLACSELDRIMTGLGLAGVLIGTNAGGRELTDPAFAPLWEVCEARAAIVFVHPESAPGFARYAAVPRLAFAVAYPNETGATAAAMIMAGFTTRYPRIRWVFAHGGGTLPWNLPRLDAVWSAFPDMQAALQGAPSRHACDFHYDTLTFDAQNLALLAERVGANRLLAGSDYPYVLMDDPPGSMIESCPALPSAAERDAVRGGNAARLLDFAS